MCRLGYFLIAAAVAILFVVYTHDVNAEDVTVQCYSTEQMEEMNDRIFADLAAAYDDGVTDGINTAYDITVQTLHEQCARDDIAFVVFPHDTYGNAVMICPSAQ